MKKEALTFIGGAIIGAALLEGAKRFIASEPGKKLSQDAQDTLADFNEFIAPKLKKMGQVTQRDYKKFITASVDEYGKIKGLSQDIMDQLTIESQKAWKRISETAKEIKKEVEA